MGVFQIALSCLCAILASAQVRANSRCKTIETLHAQRASGFLFDAADTLDRPQTPFFVDSDSVDLRVHYELETQQEDAASVLALFEGAWARQVTGLGYLPPADDGNAGGNGRLDIYLTALPEPNAMTVAESLVNTEHGWQKTSFILFDVGISATQRPLSVEHEFQHALQFATDYLESLFFFEASAVFMETLAYPEDDTYTEVIADYQQWPNAPFYADGIQWETQTGRASFYEYGGVLFLMYLDEVHGAGDGQLIAELWQGSRENEGTTNEPDFLDVLVAKGVDLSTSLADFSTWRALVNVYAQEDIGPQAGAGWSGDAILRSQTITAEALKTPLFEFGNENGLYRGGCLPFTYLAQDTSVTLQINLESNESNFSVDNDISLSGVFFDGEENLTSRWEATAAQLYWPYDVYVPADTTFLFTLCDATGNWDADDEPIYLNVSLLIGDADNPPEMQPQTEPDAEVHVDENGTPGEPDAQCACQATQDSVGGNPLGRYLFAGLWALGALVRRKKHLSHIENYSDA